jgi:hypothetical protein
MTFAMLSTVLNSVKSHVAFILNLNNYLFMSKRISSLLLILFTILFFVALLNWTVTPIQNGDLFMYLSMGKYFLTQNFYPTQDPFLFIQGGGNHFHHEWLSYLFYYNVESIWGLNAVIVVRMLFYGVLFSIPIWLAIKRKTFSYRTLGLLVLAIVSIATRVGDRAFFFSDLFTVMLVSLLFVFDDIKNPKYLAFIPLIFLAWVQFHPGFPLGLLIFSAYGCAKIASLPSNLRKWLAGSVCSSYLVCLINPLGLAGFWYPFQTFFSSDWNIYRQINSEWIPLLSSPYVADFSKWTVGFLFLTSLVASFLEARKKNVFPIIVTVILGYLVFSSMRFISIAPLVFSLICIAYPITHYLIRVKYLKEAFGFGSLMAVIVLVIHVSQFKNQGFSMFFNDLPRVNAPMKAIQQLNSLEPGTVFAEWDWNSIICWATNGRNKVVVHGHVDQPRFAVENFYSLGLSVKDFDRIVDANQVRYFLLKLETLNTNSNISARLLNPPWRVIYKENEAILFIR